MTPTPTYETLSLTLDDRVLIITLNRPDRMNAFTVQMADDLEHVFGWASAAEHIGSIVVTGAGSAYCAGMDLGVSGNVFGLDESLSPGLEDMRQRSTAPQIARGVRDTGGRVALAIFDCAKPVIAAINGAAVGIGATMLLPMDIRIASTKARFGFVFSKIGITPEACSTWFLPRIVGLPRALEWFYSGDILSAETARDAGLVGVLVEPDELLPTALKRAHELAASRSAVSLALIRQMTYRNAAALHPRQAHEVESLAVFYTSLADGKEGVSAFLEKRAPRFATKTPADLPDFYPWWD